MNANVLAPTKTPEDLHVHSAGRRLKLFGGGGGGVRASEATYDPIRHFASTKASVAVQTHQYENISSLKIRTG